MAASAVTPRPALAPKAATAAIQNSSEQIAQRFCMNIAMNQSQAVSTKNTAQLAQVIARQAEEVSKLPSAGVWTGLAKEMHSLAAAHARNGFKPDHPLSFSVTFQNPQEIKTALKNAYHATLLDKNSSEVRKCLDAAERAIASLNSPDPVKNSLKARLSLINGLIAQKNKTAAVHAPKQAPQSCVAKAANFAKRVWAHPATKIALVAVAALGIYTLATSSVSSLGVNDQAAKALADAIAKAEGLASTAAKAANDAASATTIGEASGSYVTARQAYWETAALARNFPAVQPAANTAAEAYEQIGEIIENLHANYMAERQFYSFAELGLGGLFGMSMFMFLTGIPMLAVTFFSPESAYPKITHEHFLKAAKIAKAACVHSVTKKALLSIAALSLFHATGLAPFSLKWTKFATIQASVNALRELDDGLKAFYTLWAALIPPYLYMAAVYGNTMAICCTKSKPARESA